MTKVQKMTKKDYKGIPFSFFIFCDMRSGQSAAILDFLCKTNVFLHLFEKKVGTDY